jgi:non-homologous end joining protein Ku
MSAISSSQIDERYFDSSYYLVPNEPVGQEAFAVIRDAMRGKDMVAALPKTGTSSMVEFEALPNAS